MEKKIDFITLRRRSDRILQEIRQESPSAWRRIELEAVTRAYRTPRILDRRIELKGYDGPIRQVDGDRPRPRGSAEHAYSLVSPGLAVRCPRCGGATRQQNAHFIYATDSSTRAILTPAGHFCVACPTVVVDEELLAAGIKPGFHCRLIVGIDYLGKKPPEPFRTWNGKSLIYVLDNNNQIVDRATNDDLRQRRRPDRARSRDKDKRRRTQARNSRRRGRR